MKSTRFPAILVVALCLIGRVSAVGELAHYEFDRDASDSSGNEFDGTLVGDASIYFDDERGGVLSLDGDGDYVNCGMNNIDIGGAITITTWIKVGAFDKLLQAIVTKGTAWRLARNRGSNFLEFACTGTVYVKGAVNVNDGQWHHVAALYDGSKLSLYIDGIMDTSNDTSGPISVNTEEVRIGSNSERPDREWNGLIDDVRIYDRALSEAQISELALLPIGFTYQGRLLNANAPADGLYDFQLKLYDKPAAGTQKGKTIYVNNFDVIEGHFRVKLDFGSEPNIFNGDHRWLEISVRPGDGNDTDDFVILSPRQEITPAPYALYTQNTDLNNDWMVTGNDMYSMVTGNIGIGTTNPAQKLEISQGNLLVRGLDGFNSNGQEGVLYLGNTPHYMKAVYGYGVKIGTYGAEDAVSIRQYNGNVGIGTTGPGARLDVTSSDAAAATIGADATTATGIHAVAIGANADANSNYSIAMGTDTRTDGWYSTAIGTNITVSGKRSVGIGVGISQANISSDNVMAIMGGKVGIGTTEPGAQMDVTTSSGIAVMGETGDTSGAGVLGIAHMSNGVYGLSETGNGVYGKGNSTVGGYAGYFEGDVHVNGNVGIGTMDPDIFMLAVNGMAAKPGGGSWSIFSDMRLKEISGNFERGLSELTKLNPVHYSYRDDNELELPVDKEFIGVIAQEVQNVIPEAVEENDKGYLMVNNDPIIWTMVNAIKELRAQNQELKQRLETLERTIEQARFYAAR
ncbi:MAG: tail fiber domain-containing protein [Phycisphaerae bacterium]|nr:tail fiber domain-containing protein [Phycisphaerae bacterium]